MSISSAIILAAGLGTRMRPITDTLPKPLVEVGGRPLIDYSLVALERAGVSRIVVNVHYLADELETWLKRRDPAILVSDERDRLLDSGGGVRRALPLLGNAPFLVLNADTFWLEDPTAPRDNLVALAAAFDSARMDILMLVAGLDQATGHTGRGDFSLDADRNLHRYAGASDPVIYAGALVLDPRCLASIDDEVFSLNRCFDAAIAAGRLFGLPLRGHWLTVGTPGAIVEAEAAMAAYRRGHPCLTTASGQST